MMHMTHSKIKQILDHLNQLEEDLIALPDDMWLSSIVIYEYKKRISSRYKT